MIEGTPEEQVARATVATDENGVLRYRVQGHRRTPRQLPDPLPARVSILGAVVVTNGLLSLPFSWCPSPSRGANVAYTAAVNEEEKMDPQQPQTTSTTIHRCTTYA